MYIYIHTQHAHTHTNTHTHSHTHTHAHTVCVCVCVCVYVCMYIYIDTHTYIQTERWYCQNQRWMQPTKAGKLAARTGKFKEGDVGEGVLQKVGARRSRKAGHKHMLNQCRLRSKTWKALRPFSLSTAHGERARVTSRRLLSSARGDCVPQVCQNLIWAREDAGVGH